MRNNMELIKNMKILYVEGEEVNRITLKKMLKDTVGKLFIANNGEEGLKLFELHKPEIVITGIRMPILNGIEMIKEIRKIDKDCGIIICTEVNDSRCILKSIDVGIDKYLIKPLDKNIMIQSLEKVVDRILSRNIKRNMLLKIMELNKEEKNSIEDMIKGKVSGFLKESTGKGPKNVKVILLGNKVDIESYGVLNPLEKSLLKNQHNISLVEYNRRLFYEDKQNELESLLKSIINRECILVKNDINVLDDIDKFQFEIR